MAYFTKGAFAEDPWAGKPVIQALDWPAQRDAVAGEVALHIDPGFAVETIAADLDRFALIEIAFPKFTDGRGYSIGWLLRSRFGYTREMRAVGDILFDEMQFMARCGFDSFEIVDPSTLKLLGDGRRAAAFDRFYQPGLETEVPVETRPWARRTA